MKRLSFVFMLFCLFLPAHAKSGGLKEEVQRQSEKWYNKKMGISSGQFLCFLGGFVISAAPHFSGKSSDVSLGVCLYTGIAIELGGLTWFIVDLFAPENNNQKKQNDFCKKCAQQKKKKS